KDLAWAATFCDPSFKFLRTGGSDTKTHAIVCENLQFFDVVGGHASHDGMHAAGVVADHTAQGAVVVGGGIRGKCQPMSFCGVSQDIQHQSWLNTRASMYGIKVKQPIKIFGKVHDHRDIACLPGQAGPSSARQNRRTEPSAE